METSLALLDAPPTGLQRRKERGSYSGIFFRGGKKRGGERGEESREDGKEEKGRQIGEERGLDIPKGQGY